MKHTLSAKPPTRWELFTFRLMILLGLVAMFFFLDQMLAVETRGNRYSYWMLMITFGFTCLTILHEWIHYFFITVPKAPASTRVYTVDIFTTFCAGEPYEMIEKTLTAIQAITYPHTAYLCDEANDPYLRDLCHQLGVKHVTRIEKKNAKAGNINNALKQSSGELCVVLDPDHVPFPNFLDPIVAHFNDPEVGYVQIVQAYKNHDESLIAKGAAQQTYQFYGPMMMTMNKYGTVLAIGANCTFRRTALESIGGHAAGLAEDMHTSMQLHAKGWKSVYVPAILARGLVPSTLSAYYKQQLKWSRGVFELLVSTYPKLFRQFTWQQKLHYGVIPLHYASGFIFLINFLIPITALLFDVSPMQIDLADFGLIGLPFAAAIILIRNFAQGWVMEDKERGFHVVGGLLMIGTWWVFIVGFVYTIIRREVPYIPTPKDNQEGDNWSLNAPNLVVMGLSIAAGVYGLYNDWNPYNLIMAGYAALNTLILGFTVLASRQQQFSRGIDRVAWLAHLTDQIKAFKKTFWLVRRQVYTGVRSTALLITGLLVCGIGYVRYARTTEIQPGQWLLNHFSESQNSFADRLTGRSGPVDLHRFNVLPLAIQWSSRPEHVLPNQKIDSIYRRGSLPLITWEPGGLDADLPAKRDPENVFRRIRRGDFDGYLHQFSEQVRSAHRPVFLRFAPHTARMVPPQDFKIGWLYVHNYFTQHGVNNAIWVWDAGKADSLMDFFPGKRYVDWISVTHSGRETSFKSFYRPFHRQPLFRSDLPVMLIEPDGLAGDEQPGSSVRTVFVRKRSYPEIRCCLLRTGSAGLASTAGNRQPVRNSGTAGEESQTPVETPQLLVLTRAGSTNPTAGKHRPLPNLTGVVYAKGQDWANRLRAFTKKELVADLDAMKPVGINAIRRYGPTIYDHNVLNAARSANLAVQYSFWIPEHLNFRANDGAVTKLGDQIMDRVDALKDDEAILSWHLGNAVLQKMGQYYTKPELLYQQDAYLNWLRKLVVRLKEADPNRPVTVDVLATDVLPETIEILHRALPEIDSYGLIVNDPVSPVLARSISRLRVPYFFSSISVAAYAKLGAPETSAFFPGWQDGQTANWVGFDGLKDHWNRSKFSLLQLRHLKKGTSLPDSQLVVRILKPALSTVPATVLSYHALIWQGNHWALAGASPSKLRFEWKLVRLDPYRNPVSIQAAGEGPSLELSIPPDPARYGLMLYTLVGKDVISVVSASLNTPLKMAPKSKVKTDRLAF